MQRDEDPTQDSRLRRYTGDEGLMARLCACGAHSQWQALIRELRDAGTLARLARDRQSGRREAAEPTGGSGGAGGRTEGEVEAVPRTQLLSHGGSESGGSMLSHSPTVHSAAPMARHRLRVEVTSRMALMTCHQCTAVRRAAAARVTWGWWMRRCKRKKAGLRMEAPRNRLLTASGSRGPLSPTAASFVSLT